MGLPLEAERKRGCHIAYQMGRDEHDCQDKQRDFARVPAPAGTSVSRINAMKIA
jgi:hypothetical protein